MKKLLSFIFIAALLACPVFAKSVHITDTLKKDTAKADTFKVSKVRVSNFTPADFKRTVYPDVQGKQSQGSNLKAGGGQIAQLAVTTYDAGRTAGVLDVSPGGAATYTVPVSVPPGINGVVPQVALTYNSQGGNGVAGYGWNISGLSTISRIPKTKFHDNVVSGINYDVNDRYALDGQRLLLKSGTYGANNAEYQTENYSNIRIVSKGTGANGPDYFEVYYPDGSKAFYGLNGVKTPTEFPISYTENPQGVRISYEYTGTASYVTNVLYISSIKYGTRGATTAINQINFTYKDRTRIEQTFVAGQSIYNLRILSEINVVGNGYPYRNYVLTHNTVDKLGYERVTTVQELDGSGNYAFAPIYFNYDDTNSTTVSASMNDNLSYADVRAIHANMITGDFNGNGLMDMILFKTSPKNQAWLFVDPKTAPSATPQAMGVPLNPGYFEEIFPVTALSHDNKIKTGDNIVFVKYQDDATIEFERWGVNNQSGAVKLDGVLWNCGQIPSPECTEVNPPIGRIPKEFLSGDFNGDGLTDIVSVSKPYFYWVNCDEGGETSVQTSTVHFINLDRRITTGAVTQAGNLTVAMGFGDKLYAADFNGDGKTDIIHIKSGVMYVYGFNTSNNLITLFSPYTDSRITNDYNVLIGDYNGDGKTDLMFPTAINSGLFAVFLSTGTGFQKIEQTYPFTYENPYTINESPSGSNLSYKLYEGKLLVANDINGDGKTDIIKCNTITDVYTTSVRGDVNVKFFNNIGPSVGWGAPLFGTAVEKNLLNVPLQPYPLPIFFSTNQVNFDRQFALASGSTLHLFNYEKDMAKEALMASVTQDGVSYNITYQKQTTGAGSVYESSDSRTYPYISMEQSPGLKVVKQLTRNFNGNSLIQFFSYKNAVSNIEGLGFLGFGQTTRSNWITSESDNNKIYSVSITDPLLRGAVVRAFTSKSPTFNQTIKDTPGIPADIVLNSASTGTKTTEALRSITLADGFSHNGSSGTYIAKINNPATGISDDATIADYITRTDYNYKTELLASKVFINNPVTVTTKNLLNNTNTLASYNYDSYYNVTKESTNFSGAGTKTTDITYENNPGGGYIGRPLTKKETATNNSGSFSTEEQYTYTGFLPTQIKRKGNGTPFITENAVYDTYGNLTSKTIVTADGSRTTSMQYDGSGRFMTKQTDVEGLETNYTYNTATGTLSTKTNPYSQTTTYSYDRWGRQSQEMDYLGKSSYTNYWTAGSGMTVDEFDDEGGQKITQINAIGQKFLVVAKDVLGQTVGKAYEYDIYDRQIKASEPSLGSYTQWTETEFDEYGRVKKITAPTGKVNIIGYVDLTTSVNDGTKTVKTTKDALGNVISTEDPGGTVNNTYFANGVLKSADYGGSVQTIEQDGWGRKTKLIDPSAGLYTYSYDEFGQTLTETTPKGTTTYTYDVKGKILTKQVTGDASTNMSYTYTYDPTTKLPIGTALTNADGNNTTYTYTYDSNKRLSTSVEDNAYAKFTKSLTYDAFGRIATETNEAKNKSNNITKSKAILNVYQNGDLLEIKDNPSGTSIWKISTMDARGQVLVSLLGANLKDTKSYNIYGMPQGVKIDRVSGTPTMLMRLGFVWSPQRGNLLGRSNENIAFDINGSYNYDTQDRLTMYTDVNGNQQIDTYDTRGRITANGRLGNYNYTGNSYQQNGLTGLTDFAKYHYQNKAATQNVTFNAFKKPRLIEETGKDKIFFQYNGVQQRAHMYWGNASAANKDAAIYKRHYSEDGSMEITEAGGTTSFVFYEGGDAYSAPAIWKEVVTATTTTSTRYYLHRDYLSSINMITDDAGNVIEVRQFDAWGNIRKLTNGAGNDLTAFGVLDRGYTGHEHLLSVGLINMNGRLYDPLLHRFYSPDNYVQDPSNTQSFNRYGYAMNNPLKYTDHNGEFWNYVIGAAVGVVTNGFSNLANGQNFFKGAGKAAVIGAISAGIATGIGNVAATISDATTRVAFQAAAHGLSGGTMSTLNGGSFSSGFLSGMLGSFASGIVQDAVKDPLSFMGAAETVASGALAGGLISGISGGSFWDGARNGAIAAGLNHVASAAKASIQKAKEIKFFKRLKAHYNEGTGEDFNLTKREVDYIMSKGKLVGMGKIIASNNPADISYRVLVNLYDAGFDLWFSFGRATAAYTMSSNNGVPTFEWTGFYDRFDFDPKPWGTRSNFSEAITRAYNIGGSGKAFDIKYGKVK